MFIVSLKATKKKVFIAVCTLVMVLTVIVSVGSARLNKTSITAHCERGDYQLSASDNAERLQFLGQFGWRTESEPCAHKTITIPEQFNAAYEKYNEIQKEQGLDLKKYAGKVCDSYTYQVMNYPNDKNVHANLIVYDGCVIGGDVCSAELDGFMQGFFKDVK
ncbi:MAG: DUF4830 domain-containing protein [Clostridia bacterium]|nr:DUF4830 domain-containing protein [Clostridia bacterium]